MGYIMNKAMETMRNNLVENTTIEKLLETSSVMLRRELREKETNIYLYICELVASGKLSKGYQFSIKRFNSMFINWENGKSTEKTSILPTVSDISNACKYFYSVNGLNCGFMPIVRINNDGCIIVDCVEYVENYYSTPKEKKEVKITREKQLEKIGELINDLNDAINKGIKNKVFENSDINDILQSISKIDIIESLEKITTKEKATNKKSKVA